MAERVHDGGFNMVHNRSSSSLMSGEQGTLSRGRSPAPVDTSLPLPPLEPSRSHSHSPSRPPTSAEIDAVIAAAMANAPPPAPAEYESDPSRSITPLMTNLLPAAVGQDGRVNLFVGNLPYRVRWQDLKDLFRKAGTVLRSDVSLGPDNRSRGYGSVLMGSREDAARAIDRYNGYTWQTRTLEVRPDRLPPEYEPQMHFPSHVNPHPRVFNGAMGPGPGMHPFPYPGPYGPMLRLGGYPHNGFPASSSPSMTSGVSPPHQHAAPHSREQSSPFPIAPSPLAGALTGPGIVPNALPIGDKRDSLTPAPASDSSGRAPSPAFTANGDAPRKMSNLDGSDGEARRPSLALSAGVPPPHFPVQIEGLAHQGKGLGPPQNLHDRVVFVSDMPLNMQWQDLKDLLRPAGTILRTDVAQNDNKRPMGYGTALFATENDADRAVQMFNGMEVGGSRIRVQLERDIAPETNVTPRRNGATRLPWGINTAITQTPVRQSGQSPGGFPGGPTPGPTFRGGHHPGPIAMPPYAPMDSPLSPTHTRGLPPMTPSMPGFVFHAYPETPQVHQFFGAAPFSPGLPMSPIHHNPFLNTDRYNGPISPGLRHGSAALGTPTTTVFPSAPGYMAGMHTPGPIMSMGMMGMSMAREPEYFPFVPGNAQPETPVRSRQSSGSIPPLNAKDRLADTPGLDTLMGKMELLDGDIGDDPTNAPGRASPTPARMGPGSVQGLVLTGEEETRGRHSLDDGRPSWAGVAGAAGVGAGVNAAPVGLGGVGGSGVGGMGGGERRASFGDRR